MTEKTTGATFIVGGSAVGTSVSATVGKMGLVGGFGGVGIGMVPTALAGGIVGSAAYGAFKSLGERDSAALGAVGLGAASGIGVYSAIGGMGLSFGGTAVGIGMGSMAVTGGILGLGLYGFARLIDDRATYKETPAQVFDRMEEKILGMETYASALMELEAEISGEALKQKFFALEVEDELQTLKAKVLKEKMVKAMEFQKELRAFNALVSKKLPPAPVFFQ